jgi:scyllo-inositol 2-dehydrogenase (NADP+)
VTSIGVGLAGYGLAGRLFHAPYIAAVDGLRLAAIATSNPIRQAQATAEHPGARIVASVDDLLASADVQVVVVVTPNRFHVPIGIRALGAGRHVVVDKPIAMDIPEAERLLDAAARSGRILSVYQNRRWDGDFLTVRSLLEEGGLGEIDSLEARFERWGVVGEQWREAAQEAGGPHRDLGAHLVDQSLFLFGPARRVFAHMDRRRPGSQVEDSAFVAIEHAGGVHSRLSTSLIASHTGPRLRIRGLGGEFVKDHLDPQEDQLLAGMRPNDPGFGEDPPERWGRIYGSDGSVSTVATQRGDYRWFYERFRDAVLGVGEPPVDPLDGVRGLRVLEAAERSARTGAVIAVSEV